MGPAKITETQTTPAPASTETTPIPTVESIHEQIAALAYTLWQERGCPVGSPEVDWFAAEAKLTAKDSE